MREKPANEGAIARLIDYLNDLWLISQGKSKPLSSTELQEYHNVAKRTFSDCKALKIVKLNEDKTFAWLDKNQPSRFMALRILDYRLKKTKKTIHVPIPDFAGIADTLQTIGERLAQLAVQNEKWLKRAKNDENGLATEGDLFRVDDQRLLVITALLPTIHSTASAYPNFTRLSERNKVAIEIADDLIKQLLKKD